MSFCACGGGGGSKVEPGILSGAKKDLKGKFPDKPLITLFEERLKTGKIDGKKSAIQFTERTLTYSQLNAFASCLAKGIVERLGYDYKIENPDKDLVIGLCLPVSEKTIALVLGILKTGATYLPLDPQFPENLLLEIVAAFKPVMLITDDNGKIFNKYDADKFSSACKLYSVEELWIDIEFCTEPRTRRRSMEDAWEIDFLEKKSSEEERPIAIFYTGGLCNNPTGVRMSSRAIINLASYHGSKIGKYSKSDVCSVTVALSNVVSIPQLFIPLLYGCTIQLFRRQDVIDTERFIKNVSRCRVTKLSVLTHLFYGILESIAYLGKMAYLKELKIVFCYGAFVQHETAALFFSIFKDRVSLVNSVGATITAGEVALEIYTSLKDFESKLVKERPTLGTIIDNTKLYILDEQLKLLPDGSQGEVCVAGNCLPLGFVTVDKTGGGGSDAKNKEQIIHREIVDNPNSTDPVYAKLYKTGEHGHIEKSPKRPYHRRLYLHSRHDSLAKVRGNAFSTNDVSKHVNDLEGVKNSFIFVLHARMRDQTLVAFIELEKGVNENVAMMIADFQFNLKTNLPEWAIPSIMKVFPGCLPDCKNPQSLCPSCCETIIEKEMEEKMLQEQQGIAQPIIAEPSNQYG